MWVKAARPEQMGFPNRRLSPLQINRQIQVRRIRRRGPVSNALSAASPLPSVAMRVIGSTGTEAAGMADNVTIVALQPLRTLTPSGVTEAYLGCMGSCDTWHTSNMGQTFDPEPTQWCRGPQLARFVHSTRFRSREALLSAV